MSDRKRFYPRSIADDIPEGVLSSDFFTIPAYDEQGHSEREQFRCSRDMRTQAEEIVDSRRYPFKSRGDLYRWAAFDGMRRLLHHDHTIPDTTAQMEIINIVLRRKMKAAAFEDTLMLLGQTINELERRGARGDVLEVLNEVGFQIQKCIEIDPHWGERYKVEVERRFGALRRELEREIVGEPRFIDWSQELRRGRNGDE
jgi:hypothetical protein